MDILKIQELCKKQCVMYSKHVLDRMMQRNIMSDEIEQSICNGKIIEEYPNDYPYPSCLILGITLQKRFLHIVVGVTETNLWIITVYDPDKNKWNSNFTIRKE